MNFTKEDILDRLGRSIPFFRQNAIPITLSVVVKKPHKHGKEWCSIAIVYQSSENIEEPKWNVLLPTRKDRREFGNLLAAMCEELDVMFIRPNWKELFKDIIPK